MCQPAPCALVSTRPSPPAARVPAHGSVWSADAARYTSDPDRVRRGRLTTARCMNPEPPVGRSEIESRQADDAARAGESQLHRLIGDTPFMLTRCSRDLRYV